MTFLKHISLCFLALSCSSVELIDYWKNPDIETYSPNKVLVVGMTSNLDARQKFETQLKEAFEYRGVEAVMSLEVFKSTFTTEKKNEEDLKLLESNLIIDGFDTILLTKLINIENKIDYKQNYDSFDSTYVKFREDFLKYQDAFYNPDYYEEHTIYHTETALYCICPTSNRELLWKCHIDITDPESVNETINDYVKVLVVAFEELNLIAPSTIQDITDNETIE